MWGDIHAKNCFPVGTFSESASDFFPHQFNDIWKLFFLLLSAEKFSPNF